MIIFPPNSIEVNNLKIVKGFIARDYAALTINWQINNSNLILLHHPGQQFYQWLRAHRITDDPRQVTLVMRDLELCRRFLMQKLIPQDKKQLLILHILPAYQ